MPHKAKALLSDKIVPIKPVARMYVCMDGTGVPVVTKEIAGRQGKGEDGQAKTGEVKLGCVFTRTGVDRNGRPVRVKRRSVTPGRSTRLKCLDSGYIKRQCGATCAGQRRFVCSGTVPSGYGISRNDDARSLLRAIYKTEADLLPDHEKGVLKVRLHHLANQSSDDALRYLCDELNTAETVFPGTDMCIFYELVSSHYP